MIHNSKPLTRDEVLTLRKHYNAKGIKNYFKRHYPIVVDQKTKIGYLPYLGLYDYALYLGLMTWNTCKKYKHPVGPKEQPIGSVWTGFTWHWVYDRIDLVKSGSVRPYADKLRAYLEKNSHDTDMVTGFEGTRFIYTNGKVMEVHKC